MSKVTDIIEQLKTLSIEEVKEFNGLFKAFYNPIEENEKNIKKLEKEKQEQENLDIAYKIADKIFSKLNIKAIPVSCCGKAADAPYEPYVSYYIGSDFYESLIEYDLFDEELLNEAADMVDEVSRIIPSRYNLSEEDARDIYPEHEYFCFLTYKHEFIYSDDNNYLNIIQTGEKK